MFDFLVTAMSVLIRPFLCNQQD